MDSTVAVHTKGFGVLVPGLEKAFNGRLQVGDTEKDAAADGLVVEVTEPSLNQNQPAGTGGYEVRHKPGMTFQPLPYFLVFMCAVVIHIRCNRTLPGNSVSSRRRNFRNS